MKKILLIPLMALIVLLSYADSIPGDVNGDGKVTMADANAIWNHCMGLLKETIDLSAADVNKDGSITKEDAMEAMNIFLTDKEFEEMSGDAMYIKLTTGETAVISVATITDRSMNAARDSFIVTTTEGRVAFAQAEIKERSYGAMPTKLTVSYGESTEVTNPYYATGVKTTINGGDVTLQNTNTSAEYTFELSGTTADGSLLYQGSYKATFILNGVSITSSKGAAIDIECGKRIAMELKKGTENTLTDCTDGQQKAALYSKGHLEIDKAGTLNVRGNTKHAIAAKEYIQFKNSSGTINILGAKGDAIHCQQYFLANGYTFNIDNVEGDGIQAELCGDADYAEAYPDGSIIIQGGTYDINISSDGCKVLKADGDITINAEKSTPVMTLTLSGSYVIENGAPSYTSGIKADGDINILAGEITIRNTAEGGRGIACDGDISISGSTTIVDITANGKGGVLDMSRDVASGTTTTAPEEKPKSYVMYFAMPTTGSSTGGMWGPQQSSNYWKTPYYIMNSDGTTKATLSQTVTINGTVFYKYDFGAADTGTYYLKGANYSSSNRPGGSSTSYTIVSASFTGPSSGEDYYYQVSNSYTTSGTTRTFALSNVTNQYNGSTSDTTEDSGDSFNASGIKADGNITITDGTIKIENNGVMSKSIKSKATVRIDGGKLTLSPSGGMQVINNDASYSTAIKAVDAIINGGDITITSTGTAGRGISATNVTTNGGVLTITNSGNGQSGTNDSYTAKGIKADNKIALNDGTITIRMSGTGGKGIVSFGTYTQGQTGGTGPALTVSTTGSSFGSSSSGQQGGWGGMQQSSGSSAKAIKAQGAITVYGGTTVVTTATNGAEGLESKTSINIAGGSHYLKCYDDCINSAGQINFSGGTTVCYATNNDAVDSNYGRSGAITISGGNVFAYTSAGSPEEGLDCDNNSYITITGGIAISAGGSQGGGGSSSQSVGSASQGYYLGNSPSSYGTSYYHTLCNTSGEAICTFKFEGNVSNSLSLLTAPNLGKGSVTVKYGTSAPTAAAASVANASGNDVFFITPTVTTSSTTATVTAK